MKNQYTTNTEIPKDLKMTWQEYEDQGYSPINFVLNDSFDLESVPEDKKELVATIIAAEYDSIAADQEADAEARREREMTSNGEALARFREAAKASGEIALRQVTISVAAEELSQPVTVHQGSYITPKEKAELLSGDRDSR